jgi:hypothetical protein
MWLSRTEQQSQEPGRIVSAALLMSYRALDRGVGRRLCFDSLPQAEPTSQRKSGSRRWGQFTADAKEAQKRVGVQSSRLSRGVSLELESSIQGLHNNNNTEPNPHQAKRLTKRWWHGDIASAGGPSAKLQALIQA